MGRVRDALIWCGLAAAIGVPMALAVASPLLQYRDPIYIASGFAGIIALALLLIQPLLIAGFLPRIHPLRARRIHRWIGAALVASIIIHVVGLWITSPPDVVDALLFRSPTPFSAWGVIAMWAIICTAILASLRRHVRLRIWRRAHLALAIIIVSGTIVHALLITGTMETFSKAALCFLVGLAVLLVLATRRTR